MATTQGEGEPKVPLDAIESKQGRPTADASPTSAKGPEASDPWGERANPVRETPSAAAGLRSIK